jgi:hypothetical protein
MSRRMFCHHAGEQALEAFVDIVLEPCLPDLCKIDI